MLSRNETITGREYADLLEEQTKDLDLEWEDLFSLDERLATLRGELADKFIKASFVSDDIKYIQAGSVARLLVRARKADLGRKAFGRGK